MKHYVILYILLAAVFDSYAQEQASSPPTTTSFPRQSLPLTEENTKVIVDNKLTPERIKQFEKWMHSQAETNQFSGVVLVAKNGNPLIHNAYGYASKRYQVLNQLDTKFRLGSVNKIFTATAILQLVEQGKLSLDDKLHQYISGFSDPQTSAITIRHLLTHSSGWKAYWDNDYFLQNMMSLRTIEDYMVFIKKIPLDFEPGTQSAYSNTGYEVLGAIIEKVAGESYFDFVEQQVFHPAGMTETASLESDQISEGLATGYTNRDFEGNNRGTNFEFHNTLMSPPKGTAAGGGCSTAADLLRFVTAITQRKIVNQESEEFLRSRIGATSKPSNYVFHNGGAPGQGVWMQSDVSNGYSIIVLSNYGYPAAAAVVRKISKSFDLPIFN